MQLVYYFWLVFFFCLFFVLHFNCCPKIFMLIKWTSLCFGLFYVLQFNKTAFLMCHQRGWQQQKRQTTTVTNIRMFVVGTVLLGGQTLGVCLSYFFVLTLFVDTASVSDWWFQNVVWILMFSVCDLWPVHADLIWKLCVIPIFSGWLLCY